MTAVTRRRALCAIGAVAASGGALGPGTLRAGVRRSETPRDLENAARLVVDSPGGALTATVTIEATGRHAAPRWQLDHRTGPVLLPSRLGLSLPEGRWLGVGAILLDHRVATRDDTWRPPYGIQSEYGGPSRELTVTLRDPATGAVFDIIVRLYDAAGAIRYRLREAPRGGALTLSGEATHFRLPAGALVYASRDESQYQVCAPAMLAPAPDPALTRCSDPGPLADIPVSVRIGGQLTVLIAESDRHHYPRTMVRAAGDDPQSLVTHLMRYPGRADGWSGPGNTPAADTFAIRAPFETPWRVLVVGRTPGEVIENAGLITTLGTPSRIGEMGWIRPGRAIRVFRDNRTEAGLAHIDFAATRKLQYIEFDAHWYGDGTDPSDATYPVHGLDIRKVIEYGKRRDVGVILYVDRVPAQRQIEAIVRTYREWGAAGVKFGFLWEGRQADNDFVEQIVRESAEHQLIVDLHDDLRPCGLEREYPNLLTLEGVRGNEHFPAARHNVTLPFVRNVAGAMDYTICYAQDRNQTTRAHQLAMAAVYYSPLTFLYWYDAPAKYDGGHWPELSWFDECPTTWDETRVLSGAIGEHVAIARRSGARWFLGAMTNEEPRRLELSLGFLAAGRWRAHIYADGAASGRPPDTPIVISERPVDRGGTLEMVLAPSGGQAVRFERG